MSSTAVDLEPHGVEGSAAREWRVLGRLEKTAIGTRGADGAVRVRRREPAGCLLYGPYWQLSSGAYRLVFRARPGKPRMPSQPVMGVEVIALNRIQLAWLDLTAAELQGETATLDFLLPPALGLGAGDEARLEFRFFHLRNAALTITSVELHSLEAREVQPAVPRVWRMLGRLLTGGRPLLQLPEGRYCLGFRCDVGRPRMASQPVLGVEVIARRRWQNSPRQSGWNLLRPRAASGAQLAWRDFTAAELRGVEGSLNFPVPAELALEGGQDVIIDLRFVDLGNAYLTIDAVELRGTAPEEAVLAAPEWRLLGRLAKGRVGRRDGDRVRVRQAEPAGCLLQGGRPHLQLPAGRYRLDAGCRVGPPRDPSAPAFQIDVIARTRHWPRRSHSSVQARRSFSAADPVAIDFEVPPELGQEANPQINFEFRFVHLGNADLEIGAVRLQKTPAEGELEKTLASPAIAAGKTNVLVIGNCQAQTVFEGLARAGELNSRLNARYHFVGLQQNLHELGKAELASSDVLLVQEIRDWENYPLRQHIRGDQRIIKFPLLHFASLWPFDHYNGPGDKEAYEREWPNLTFLYHDGLLARLRKQIPDPERRLEAYRSLSVEGLINFVRLHDFEQRRLLAMDKQFGLQIGRFVLDNFRRKRLFYTTNHPNAQIVAVLMRYLLRQLGIERAYRPGAILDHLNRLQVPVHPKVAAALGVKWADENTKYLYDGERITWETYVRRYIEHYG